MTLIPRLFATLAGAFLLASPCLRADDSHEEEARAAAKVWLGEIDSGKFEQSYIDGGTALHDKVPQDTWIKILKAERPPLGKVIKREETDHSYRPNGFEGVDGEFIVFSYHSSFETKPNEVEYLVLRREDGKWRGIGYNFGPAEVVNDPDAAPVTTTTSETNAPPVSDHPIVVPAKRTH